MNDTLSKDDVIIGEILAAAKKLFAQHGLKKTTMEDIAQSVGKGKSTLYYYFPSKIEIFEAVIEHEMKNLDKVTRLAINEAKTAKEKLKAYLVIRLSSIHKYQNLSQILYEDVMTHMCDILRIKQKHDHTRVNMIKEIITGGIQTGEFKDMSEDDVTFLAFIIAASFRGLEIPMAVSPVDCSFFKREDRMINMLVEGIGR